MWTTTTCCTSTPSRKEWTSRSAPFFNSRETLWELYQQATSFGTTPAELLGLPVGEDPWLAYQINRATWKWGSFIEGQAEAMIEKPLRKTRKKRETELVPKWTPEEIHEFIYGTLSSPQESQRPRLGKDLSIEEFLEKVKSGEVAPRPPAPNQKRRGFIDPTTALAMARRDGATRTPVPDTEDDTYVPIKPDSDDEV